MGMIYQWKEAAHVSLDAQLAGEELERIRAEHDGHLEASMVVDASRSHNAPLHKVFEWDDSIAAEAYREDQARYIIRHIDVVVAPAEKEARPVRAFVSVVRDDARSYTSVQHALSEEELRAQVLASAWAELEAWRRRHAELIELAKVFAVIDKARPA